MKFLLIILILTGCAFEEGIDSVDNTIDMVDSLVTGEDQYPEKKHGRAEVVVCIQRDKAPKTCEEEEK